MSTLLDNATVLEIKGNRYSVEPVDPGFAGVAALRVEKLADGEVYHVVLWHDGSASCECPDFVCRHEDSGTHCKHIRGVLAAGLLVAPVRGGSPEAVPPAAVAPVTEMDRKRAAYFGLKLPDAAKVDHILKVEDVVGPPAPAAELLKDPVEQLNIPVEQSPAAEWSMGESVALLVTTSAIEDGDEDAFYRLDEEFRDDFFRFLMAIESQAATWSSWLALCRSGSPASFPGPVDDGPRPTHRERFVPSAEDMAAAALLFADRRHSCLEGEAGPSIGDLSFPRRARTPRYTGGTGMTDADVHPRGVC